jgi:carbonic anhydrase/acetyltransferase-like protein (isoleucine patch superfamily)
VNLRYFIARSEHPVARVARRGIRAVLGASVPAPRVIVLPIVRVWGVAQGTYYLLKRKFIAEPFLKAQCVRHGRNVRTGVFVHWISGSGDIVLGDDVLLDGKSDIMFSGMFRERPRLEIGDRTYVNHRCSFAVSRRITIGRDVYIATNVRFLDSPGHPLDPAERLAKRPPPPESVRPITVEDNVWIGMDVVVLPGVTIGEGSVIATGAVVTKDVPPYTLAGGVPARPVRSLAPGEPVPGDAHDHARGVTPVAG